MNRTSILATLVTALIRGLGFTLRIRVQDVAGYWDPQRKTPIIAAAWHNRILALPIAYARHRKRGNRPLVVLTSTSRDGGLLASVVGRFGIGAVRGSSSRRGAAAVLQLARELARDSDVIITPDGPRGPRYTLGPGIVFLAQKTGSPMVWVDVTYSRYWELRSWDRFRIPKPFSRVEITLRHMGVLEPASTEEVFEADRLRLQEIMHPREIEEDGELPAKEAKGDEKEPTFSGRS